jgi:hypothetical protein
LIEVDITCYGWTYDGYCWAKCWGTAMYWITGCYGCTADWPLTTGA